MIISWLNTLFSNYFLSRDSAHQELGTLKIVDRRIIKITNTIGRIIEADFKLYAREVVFFTGQIIEIY